MSFKFFPQDIAVQIKIFKTLTKRKIWYFFSQRRTSDSLKYLSLVRRRKIVNETKTISNMWNLHKKKKKLPLSPWSLPNLCNSTSKSFLFGTRYSPQVALRVSAAPLMKSFNYCTALEMHFRNSSSCNDLNYNTPPSQRFKNILEQLNTVLCMLLIKVLQHQ